MAEKSAPAPTLTYVFSAKVALLLPQELGDVDGLRTRFIPIVGGVVSGDKLHGKVLGGGGDWQKVNLATGLTEVYARYQIQADDGTIIEVINPGVRVGSPQVIARLAKGEDVDPSLYYFRTTPHFTVRAGAYDWLRTHVFVARGIRKPDSVIIDYYMVE
jgi:Protein of unknown function (DUF3237)